MLSRLIKLCVAILAVQASPAQGSDLLQSLEAKQIEFAAVLRGEVPDSPHSLLRQRLAALQSMAGRHDEALEVFEGPHREQAGPPTFAANLLPSPGSRAVAAVDVIVARAAEYDLVTINEAHHVPAHRALMLALLEPLHRLGYRYLALEGLDPADEELERRGYAKGRLSGSYLAEPIYGELVRSAMRLGYRVIGYDRHVPCEPGTGPDEDCLNQRQARQASGIASAVAADGRPGKIVVLVGYDHGALKASNGFNPMGARLAHLLAARHFSVDQVTTGPVSRRGAARSFVEHVGDKMGMDRPFVLVGADDTDWQLPQLQGLHTLHVFWPHPLLPDGRPAWMRDLIGRRAVVVDATACGTQESRLLHAHSWNEPPDATPLDRVWLRPGEVSATLYLPPGDHRLSCEAPQGRTVSLALPSEPRSSRAP